MVFVKEWRWRRALIRQHDLSDCGPACLVAMCRYYRKYVTISKIRQLAKTGANGTTLLGVVEAATALDFDAKGVRAESAECISLPAIVHVIIGARINHYIVLLKVKARSVTVMDPAGGVIKRMCREEFASIWTGIAVLLNPNENFRINKGESNLKKISGLISPFRRSLVWASIFAAVVSFLGITVSVYVREIVDVILVSENTALLNVASLITIIVLLIQCAVTIIKGRIVLTTGKLINTKLIMSYYRHVLSLPQSFFDSMRVGEMLSRINDAAKITAFIHELAVNLVVDALIVIISGAAMIYANWKIGLLIMSVIPLYGIMFFISNRLNKRWQRKIALSSAEVDAALVETLGAGASIRNLALENYFGDKVLGKLEGLLKNIYEASVKQLHIQGAGDMISKLMTVLLLWIGSYSVMKNDLTTGELMSLYTLLLWFTVPLLYLLGTNRTFTEALISAERLFEIMELQPEENGCKKINAERLVIEFRDVWFAYGYNEHVLKGINLSVVKGQVTGISGKSGSGKSTLASLLVRDYRPTSGIITVNDVDINQIDRQSIVEIMTIVSQKTDLFSGTLRENITIGMRYDEERLTIICEKLGIAEFASLNPAGLDMVISEQGNNLSGGQKQRIAIARALYRNVPLLILDEATTALDFLSEQKIMQTIEWYKNNGNTVIIIAHSESTLKICDNIVVLENGVIK